MNINFRERLAGAGAVCLAILSTAIAIPASAATPQQCATLRTLLNNTATFERTVLDQRKMLLAQPAVLAGAILALRTKYERFVDDDFRGIETVSGRLDGVSSALTGDFDARLKVINDSVTVVGELCR
ncbi:hypothetical protein ACFW16_09520 [Inquilinus sp. NPDC058860]|uniref:hypothetical protein n=1 Tax=Inquilinus sp. NPDC058860 TaxID=3346652 RepID=UPI0036B0177F